MMSWILHRPLPSIVGPKLFHGRNLCYVRIDPIVKACFHSTIYLNNILLQSLFVLFALSHFYRFYVHRSQSLFRILIIRCHIFISYCYPTREKLVVYQSEQRKFPSEKEPFRRCRRCRLHVVRMSRSIKLSLVSSSPRSRIHRRGSKIIRMIPTMANSICTC